MSEPNTDELGALWVKTGSKGDYMTGTVNGVKVVCFRNTRAHDNPKAPQWRVMKSRPQGENATPARESAAPVTDDSIPF
jgi:hypothetical protein